MNETTVLANPSFYIASIGSVSGNSAISARYLVFSHCRPETEKQLRPILGPPCHPIGLYGSGVMRTFRLIVHQNVTGWFLLPGKADERFIYNVRIIRNGGYSTRGVDVVQESDPGVCFTCTCSFKKPEKESTPRIDIRQRLDLRKEFSAVLRDKQPHEHEEMPGVDAPWYWEFSKRNGGYTDPFPGLHLHKVDMDLYNNPKASDGLDHRNLKYYSVRGDMPAVGEDANIHLCAHLYASDRNSLFVISNHLGVGNDYSQMGSLSHTVIFHGTAEELDMIDRKTGGARWFCQEAWTGG
ncbi:hypothetical protein LTR33_015268, partial [Friedmanniomyces endolithicus]